MQICVGLLMLLYAKHCITKESENFNKTWVYVCVYERERERERMTLVQIDLFREGPAKSALHTLSPQLKALPASCPTPVWFICLLPANWEHLRI